MNSWFIVYYQLKIDFFVSFRLVVDRVTLSLILFSFLPFLLFVSTLFLSLSFAVSSLSVLSSWPYVNEWGCLTQPVWGSGQVLVPVLCWSLSRRQSASHTKTGQGLGGAFISLLCVLSGETTSSTFSLKFGPGPCVTFIMFSPCFLRARLAHDTREPEPAHLCRLLPRSRLDQGSAVLPAVPFSSVSGHKNDLLFVSSVMPFEIFRF